MDNDDHQIGKILTRREALAMLGVGGLAFLAACGRLPQTLPASLEPSPTAAASPSSGISTPTASLMPPTSLPACVVRPAQSEGPYFVDEMLDRSDIRSDPSNGIVKEGVPLELTFRLSQIGAGACTPLPGAMVDVWHCDALGVYSDVSDSRSNTVGQKFLRGYQVTNETGLASFTTIYPGWYQGRTVHIHFKIRGDSAPGTGYEFTSQLYFDDLVSDQVFTNQPYAGKGERSVRNDGDPIFRNGGDQLTLVLTSSGEGYIATFDIGVQLG